MGGPIVLRMNSSLTMEKALWMEYHRHCHVRDVAYLKDLLCVDIYADSFELFSVSQPTIMDCGWVKLKDGTVNGQIFNIPVQVYNSYSDCLVDEKQWQGR